MANDKVRPLGTLQILASGYMGVNVSELSRALSHNRLVLREDLANKLIAGNAVRYIVKLKLVPQAAHEEKIRHLLQKYGLPFKQHDAAWEVNFEKGNHRLATIQEAFSKLGYDAPPFYEPLPDEREVDQSELLHVFIRGLCGKGFTEWADELGMPAETRIMDKRDMRNQDIALTFDFDPVISTRLKDISYSRESWRLGSSTHLP